jgi:four helix bundle protein
MEITNMKTETNERNLKQRTKKFALDVIRIVETLPKDRTSDVLGRQLLRCGTSVGANYRSANRAKSPADFIAKISIVEEEADECVYWLELLIDSQKLSSATAASLLREAGELTAIAVASANTARRNCTQTTATPSNIPRSALRVPRSQGGSAFRAPRSAFQ